MPPEKSAAAKAHQEIVDAIREQNQQSQIPQNDQGLSDSSLKPPKCKEQGGATAEHMSGMEETEVDKMDTTTEPGKDMAQPLPYQYDPLPCLDDEPAGGLRSVSRSCPMRCTLLDS